MLDTLAGFLSDYGYALIFVSIFLESTGLPFPGESLLIAAGIMAGHGKLDVHGVVLASFVGGTMGDNLGYLVGYRYGRNFLLRFAPKLGLSEETYGIVERRFQAVGPPLVLVARFVVILRQCAGFASGALRFPWWRFLVFNALGAALWSAAYGYGAFVLGDRLNRYLHGGPWLYAGIAAVFAIIAGTTALRLRAKLRRERKRADEPPINPSA